MLSIYKLLMNQRMSTYKDICEQHSIFFNPLLLDISYPSINEAFLHNIFYHDELKKFMLQIYYDSIKIKYCLRKYICYQTRSG